MWIVVGGLTFLLSFSYFLYQRRSANWTSGKGEMPVALTRDMLWQLTTGSKGGSYRLGIGCPEHFDFLIGQERMLDRVFKASGLTHELEVQDRAFDDAIYVGCDDLYLQRLLKRSADARSAIQNLMQRHRNGLMGRVTLHCRSGRLWLQAGVKAKIAPGELAALIRADARDLGQLQSALAALPTMLIEPVARRIRWQAAVLATLAAALATCAVVGWLLYGWGDDIQLQLNDLFSRSLLPALLLWGALLAATFILLARTSRFHLVLIEVILLGSWGAFGTVANVNLHLNMAHDPHEAIVRCSSIVDKYTRRSRKGGTRYYLELSGWQLGNGNTLRDVDWKASSSQYHAYEVGERIGVLEHPGRYQLPWLSDLGHPCPDVDK